MFSHINKIKNMFKIVTNYHLYGNKTKIEYLVYTKKIFNWNLASDDNSKNFQPSYNSNFEAEIAIFNYCSTGLGGIVSVDGNIYNFSPYSLPLP